jgi:hypothetical protein
MTGIEKQPGYLRTRSLLRLESEYGAHRQKLESRQGLEKDLGRDFEGEACNRIKDRIELPLDETFLVLQLPP